MAELQWTTINDFTPGIYSNISPNHPDGAANPDGTFRCHAILGNSLAPLPRMVNQWRGPLNGSGVPVDSPLPDASTNINEENRIIGVHARGAVFDPALNSAGFQQDNTDVFVTFERWEALPGDNDNDIFYTYRLRHNLDNPVWDLIRQDSHQIEPFNPFKIPPTGDFETMRSNSADRNAAGPVVTAFANYGFLHCYPDDTAPTSDGTPALPGNSGDPLLGGTLGALNITEHQGRLVIFPLLILGSGIDTLWVSNEAYFWTQVNDIVATDLTNYFNISVGWDMPAGYQVMASVTSDELLLVRTRGGAAVVRGDLDNFTVVKYPYVRSAGFTLNRGTKTPKGFVYPVDGSGMWLWTGGQVSTQLTLHLENDFWRPPTVDSSGDTVGFLFYPSQCSEWGDLILLPNNYVWDTALDGPNGQAAFWRMGNPDDFIIHRWTSDYRQTKAYGTPSGIIDASDTVLYEWDRDFLESNYEWESHPISNTLEKMMEVSELIIIGSGEGTVNVRVFSSEDPVGSDWTFPISGTPSAPTVTRHPIRKVRGSMIAMKVIANAADPSNPAPTIHELRYGFVEGSQITSDQ